jgi:hypothetical protein
LQVGVRIGGGGSWSGALPTPPDAEVESRAFIDAAGGCGWCGSRIAHVDTAGRSILPRDWHRNDIGAVLRVDGLRPHAGR